MELCVLSVPKRKLQELTRSSVGWDDAIKEQHHDDCHAWCGQLVYLELWSIQCPYSPLTGNKFELHNFDDAFEIGYDACAYVSIVNDVTPDSHSLVLGRSHLHPMTVLWLELTAALTAS